MAKKICDALKVHTRIEEEIFCPAFLEATGRESIHDEAIVEHDGAKKLVAEIEKSVLGDRMVDARVTVLSEMIKHQDRNSAVASGPRLFGDTQILQRS